MAANMAMTTRDDMGMQLEQLLIGGNLTALNPEQRVIYYRQVCQSLGLNYLTKPFDYITLNGKLTLYARKDATDQLRKLHGVSITNLEREEVGGVYVVTAYASDKEGRRDSSVGAVSVEGLKGEARANAMMKAESKAKRRVTLSLCGLGFLDETETASIPDAQIVNVNQETGVIEGEVRPVETAKPQAAPTASDTLAAEYKRLYGKAIDLGLPLTKDGHTLPAAIPSTSPKLGAAVEWLRNLVTQAEDMTEQAA